MNGAMLFNIICSAACTVFILLLVLCFVNKKLAITIDTVLHKVMLTVAEIALASMIVIVFFTVLLRYCFHTGIGWAEEVPRLLVNLFAFCACAIGVRDHLHISVTVVYAKLKNVKLFNKLPLQTILDYIYDFAVLLCGVFMFYYGMQYFAKLFFLTGKLPMTGLNTCYQYLPAGIAGFIVTCDSILFLTKVLKPTDLLYTEQEVDYTEMMKQNKAEQLSAN